MLDIFLWALLVLSSAVWLHRLVRRRRRDGEPPLIQGWIPFFGKALDFRKDSFKFLQDLQEKHGSIFTVLIAGKYMTFVMDPLLYPAVIKHGKQLDFHEFSDAAASKAFGYPRVRTRQFPGLNDQIQKAFHLLQGSALNPLTMKMVTNLQLVLRQTFGQTWTDQWKEEELYEFCERLMFEATFLTLYGHPPYGKMDARTTEGSERWIDELRKDFRKFDSVFPLLIAQVPIGLLGRTKYIREKIIQFFHPQRMAEWLDQSEIIQTRVDIFQRYDTLKDLDRAAHHLAILWASVGNTIPACFWCIYHLLSHPQAFATVTNEIVSVIGEKGAESDLTRDITLTTEQLDKMVYLESAVNESLRLASVSMNIRIIKEDFRLTLNPQCSVSLRKGDVIALYPQSTHMDPEIYSNPQQYQFDRFVEDGKTKTDFYKGDQKVRYHHMPFGSGVSMCPGRFFAINEMKQFVCLTMLTCEMQLIDIQQQAALDKSRAGLGILPPVNHIPVRYRLKQHGVQTERLQESTSE